MITAKDELDQATQDAPLTPNTLINVNRVKDTPVYNTFGDKIGAVVDMLVERHSGRTAYVLMSFGGFLGIGEKIHPLPWDRLKYDTLRRGYVIPLTKEELTNAPSYSSAELISERGSDADFATAVRDYYDNLADAA